MIAAPLVGKGEWLNTSLYRLIPENLQPYTRYELRVPASLSAQPDGVLQEDFRWSFTTVGPAIEIAGPPVIHLGRGPTIAHGSEAAQAGRRSGASKVEGPAA